MLEDPVVNFAISNAGRMPGIAHLGIQGESPEALSAIGKHLDAAGGAVVPEMATICCYAQLDRLWTEDPQGTRWETFRTVGEATAHNPGDAPCATDATTCSTDVSSMKPHPEQ